MKDNFKDPFIDRWVEIGRQQGLLEGRRLGWAAAGAARVLIMVLAARGIAIPEQVLARIDECADIDQLEKWAFRAATSTSVDEVFASQARPARSQTKPAGNTKPTSPQIW
jgi:hypothetical protein